MPWKNVDGSRIQTLEVSALTSNGQIKLIIFNMRIYEIFKLLIIFKTTNVVHQSMVSLKV